MGNATGFYSANSTVFLLHRGFQVLADAIGNITGRLTNVDDMFRSLASW
ncbi:MAG: hypothetical protein R2865_04185 [Deinococcales bacterium]